MKVTFNDLDCGSTIELEQVNENALEITINDYSKPFTDEPITSKIIINNRILFQLLGALHYIQKDLPRYEPKKK